MVDFKPNLFDRALSVIAPTTATRRLAARVAFGNLARAYAGQAQGRLSGDWRAPSTAADAEVAGAGMMLRDRMRDLVRNNPMAAKAIQVLVLSPFPEAKLLQALESVHRLIAVECNSTAQLARLVGFYGIKIHDRILKYDGRPFSLDDLQADLGRILG